MEDGNSSLLLEEALGSPHLHKLWEDSCPVNCPVFLLSKATALYRKHVEPAGPPHQDLVLSYEACRHLPLDPQVERVWVLITPVASAGFLILDTYSPSNHVRQLEDEL